MLHRHSRDCSAVDESKLDRVGEISKGVQVDTLSPLGESGLRS